MPVSGMIIINGSRTLSSNHSIHLFVHIQVVIKKFYLIELLAIERARTNDKQYKRRRFNSSGSMMHGIWWFPCYIVWFQRDCCILYASNALWHLFKKKNISLVFFLYHFPIMNVMCCSSITFGLPIVLFNGNLLTNWTTIHLREYYTFDVI